MMCTACSSSSNTRSAFLVQKRCPQAAYVLYAVAFPAYVLHACALSGSYIVMLCADVMTLFCWCRYAATTAR
jgi:hypothetical protein